MQWNPILANVVRGVTRLHATLYRVVGGKGLLGKNTLIVTTRGRKTGREVPTPLLYIAEGERLYIVASFGGSDTPPHWYRNLLVHPDVKVELGGATRGYRARSLNPEEAAPLWPKLKAMYPPYDSYQKKTTRVIPIVELSPL
ncbi:MAG: nitroreductase family deazaflavin-dependent oxidoreductase [Deltaproteobacteria bacterium]|nr:nitroreductase family deazaflavin-dependent oxidoreductase [Deltaproteobacteria bacterium]MBI3386188.1 nitroreductase family deazaflavin-dependent oxidoreductase [Deltaproteobacteria bacterium]